MRVLHVISSLATVHGGTTAAVKGLERSLSAVGVEVETATTDDDGHGGRQNGGELASGDGVRRHVFAKGREFYLHSPSFARWIGSAVEAYDIVHTHGVFSHLPSAAGLAARRRHRPLVISPHGMLMRWSLAQKPWRKKASLALVEGRALAHASAVHFTAEAERDDAMALGIPIRPAVIPLGIEAPEPGDAARFRARHPGIAGRPIVLFLSRLHHKKNLEGLIDALALLGREGDESAPALVVCGTGDPAYEAALRQRATGRGIDGRTVWAGFVGGTDKADALAAADVFALPSHSENFGVAVTEALFAGLPSVIGRGIAIAGEIEAAGAATTTGTGADEVADALRAILALSPDDRAAMAKRAVDLARSRYSATASAQHIRALYEEILSGRR